MVSEIFMLCEALFDSNIRPTKKPLDYKNEAKALVGSVKKVLKAIKAEVQLERLFES